MQKKELAKLWDLPWRPIHLLGNFPEANIENTEPFALDSLLERWSNKNFEEVGQGETIAGNPFTGMAKIQGKEEETFSSLDLVLQNSGRTDEYPKKENPNPELGKDPGYLDKQQKLPYASCLQILEALLAQGLKAGALPQRGCSGIYRFTPALAIKEVELPLHPIVETKLVKPKDIKIVLQGEQKTYFGPPRNPTALHCREGIGIEWKNQGGSHFRFIPKDVPFVMPILTSETEVGNNPTNLIEYLCNEAFIELSRNDPKKAQTQIVSASEWAFFYFDEEDPNYKDLDSFHWENDPEMELFWNREKLLKTCEEELQKTIQSAVKKYLNETEEDLHPELSKPWENKSKFHMKFLQVKGGKISLDVTLETNQDVWKVQGEAGAPLQSTRKTRNRKEKARPA